MSKDTVPQPNTTPLRPPDELLFQVLDRLWQLVLEQRAERAAREAANQATSQEARD